MNVTGSEPIRILFRKLDPFRKYPSLYNVTTETGVSLALRPFWILGDLQAINSWQLPERHAKYRLLKHFKDMLESDQGQSLLVPEALRTVMQWKYEPTYLNGVPYPIQLTITVHFAFAS